MRGPKGVILAALVAGACVLVILPLVMVAMVMGGTADQSDECVPSSGSFVLASGVAGGQLDERQLAHASTIVSEGRRLAMPDRAITVALAVASQESGFRNYANDGQGSDLKPDQRGIEHSLELAHEAVGTDHGSLGIFQQQWPWWGTMTELMDPATASRKFYLALRSLPGWAEMSIGDAAQAVQKSAYPDAYDDDVALALELLDSAPGSSGVENAAYFGSTNPGWCLEGGAFAGDVVMPLSQEAAYVDQVNFGHSGSHWESTHTGSDFSASCGTPVQAATAGVVTVRTDQSWAGPWLVQIDSGDSGVVTWYAHMQAIQVETGDRVTAGQRIGEVGTLGNSTGCHLHFEVRPGGGEPVDPTRWLSENVGQQPGTVPASTGGAADLPEQAAMLITANIPHWLSNATVEHRIHQLLSRRPDVLILQEMGHRDVTAMASHTRGSWAVWPKTAVGGRDRTVIVWNTDKFRAAQRGLAFGVKTPQYGAWMPWVLLEGGSGTLPVVGMHLPTNASRDPRMAAYFKTMTRRYLRLFGQMNRAGYPPVVGGDWNHPLHEPRESWSPVPQLRRVGLSTNWQHGRPCLGTSARNGRIDGFAFNPDYLAVVRQGCLDRGPSDHRPVWMAVAPTG